MECPDHLRYTREHEWVDVEGDIATIGITDHAQDQLGDIVYLELPDEGDDVERGKPFGVVESVKAVSDIYAPLSGTVSKVNQALVDSPETLNTSPYGDDGWLVKIEVADPDELDELMSAEDYKAYVEAEG